MLRLLALLGCWLLAVEGAVDEHEITSLPGVRLSQPRPVPPQRAQRWSLTALLLATSLTYAGCAGCVYARGA